MKKKFKKYVILHLDDRCVLLFDSTNHNTRPLKWYTYDRIDAISSWRFKDCITVGNIWDILEYDYIEEVISNHPQLFL